ncbi:MAG: NUDIX hydrolase [Firmicutes bacterium]|nr:NUDIX hydrolase [Bacillota bacterium]
MDIVNPNLAFSQPIKNPTEGLPDEVFNLISKITPLVNVDLLIKDETGRTLLSWRDDLYTGKGWHLPGGIIRFKETFETRIQKVAETEIGAEVSFDPAPLAINQIIVEQDERGHFVSILYKCFLSNAFVPQNKGLTEGDRGYLKWHDVCPDNLIKAHEIYRRYI